MSHPDKKLSQVLSELKAEYLEKLPARIEILKQITAEQDWVRLEEEYHKLKGTGKTYGYPQISQVCERLETLAHNKDTQIHGLFTQAVELLERMRKTYENGQEYNLKDDATVKAIMTLGTRKL